MTHPSEEIYCEKSDQLDGKRIIMGITGSIAAVECFSTIREFIRHGAEVIPVMSEEAQKIVTKESLQFASGYEPITDLSGMAEHVTLMGDKEDADLLLIYPATANTISKIANGIDDTPVTSMASVALGTGIPIAIAPAMHQAMYDNPAVRSNLDKLGAWGVEFIGPRLDGVRAKVATPEQVVACTSAILSDHPLKGKKVLVIGGRSEEPIDSMRLITNHSTGLMAVCLAQAAFNKGAKVDLWMGGCSVSLPEYIETRRFESVKDLVEMVDDIDHDIVIVPAALADFTPSEQAEGKIPSELAFDLKLESVSKVLPLIRKRCPTVIGFKAESGVDRKELIERARDRLVKYDLYAVVANDIVAAGKESSSVILVREDFTEDISGTKLQISESILDQCFGDL
ncbi:MAG: bifunctional phosphopantothenoylcysteine decarboxylase/phosphopantothenate--cysteine ligase CoaBC [Candidatus Methanomethylophilaceae archaeon]|nr:bifunctional phosphopantothenoylcysteine decarboxylase/phosphopantothenate--cysteine ligase CoaBC [Candidatus Methanomethylophilaceae archaeon]MBR4686221.1 bifunctional phosphopantothenoylcysteine decarboxylase/phosphopantothenate--cysteine ligase CoaBC [Candidatus Methanomethylophilaceae archaeon]